MFLGKRSWLQIMFQYVYAAKNPGDDSKNKTTGKGIISTYEKMYNGV